MKSTRASKEPAPDTKPKREPAPPANATTAPTGEPSRPVPTLTYVLGGVGLLALGGALVIYLTRPEMRSVAIIPGAGGASLRATF